MSVLVVDVGRHRTRFGLAAQDLPSVGLHSIGSSFKDSGTRLKTFSYSEDVQFESLAEPEAQLRPLYDVREAAYDTEVLEAIWAAGAPTDQGSITQPMLVVDPVGPSSAKFRAQISELCFEKYNTPSVSFVKDAPLQCYSLGRTSGFVVDCAAHGTRTCAVVEGWAEDKGQFESALGGDILDRFLLPACTNAATAAAAAASSSSSSSSSSIDPFWPRQVGQLPNSNLVLSSSTAFPILPWLRCNEARQLKHRLASTAYSNSESISSSSSESSGSAMETSETGEESSSSSSNGKPQGIVLPDGTAINLPLPFLQAEGRHLSGFLTGILFGGSPYASTLDPQATLAANFPPALEAPTSVTGGAAAASAIKALPESAVSGVSGVPLPQLLAHTLAAFDKESQSQLCRGVVLAGGSSTLPGLGERLKAALQPLAPPQRARTGSALEKDPVVVYRATGLHAGYEAWLGGSILASLGGFQERSVTKAEYEEHGMNLFAKRCP